MLLAVSFAVGTVPTVARADDGLEALLARVRAAAGEPDRVHVASRGVERRGAGTVDLALDSEGLRYDLRRCVRAICSGLYFDGSRAFATNLNGSAVPLPGLPDALQRTYHAVENDAFASSAFRNAGGTLARCGGRPANDPAPTCVRVRAPGGAELDVRVDRATGLVAEARDPTSGHVISFRDERRIDGGVTLPFAIVLDGVPDESFASRAIVATPLRAPAGLRPAFDAASVTVPMLPLARASDQPVVACALGGIAVRCLLDTGNSGMSLSLELAERLELEPMPGAFSVTGVGQYLTGVVKAPGLAVGGVRFPAAEYVVLDDLEPYGYDVVLGTDAFAHARVTLDYPARAVTFAPADVTAAPDPAAFETPLTFRNFIPVASVGLDDAQEPLVIDTGDESAIALSAETAARHPGLISKTGTATIAGIGGVRDATLGTLALVRFAGTTRAAVPVAVMTDATPTASGHLGSGFLRRYVVTFDYERERMLLTTPAASR
jgi:predicted aspartyl protease